MDNPIFINKEYESTKRINTLPFRASFTPFPLDQEFAFSHRIIDAKRSRMLIDLNGKWEFKEHRYFKDCKSIDESLSDHIDVPSCVQMKGYDYFQYINLEYPFPFNPPYVPEQNPLFHYRKKVNLQLKGRYYLNFEGVDSCFYLYINGRFAGFSQISHSKSEFDVTDFLQDGDNVIDVLVLKWCASSYLEDQDKFRFSGIFRDVYLLNRHAEHIIDYKIEPIYRKGKWAIAVSNLSKWPFMAKIRGAVKEVHPEQTAMFEITNPRLWSEGDPYLYSVVLSDEHEKIFERVGLRRVEIKNGIFLFNGKPIKLRGVNRHESSPYNGASVTIEETIKDLRLIKSIHANAIRTSHYPDRHEFYELCDLYGIYVLDEADIESHGAHIRNGVWDYPAWQEFADCGLYDEACYDRLVSLYERDKNRTCVIIFSLGNESNYGKMFHAGADYIHAHDKRPIHYEGIWNLYDKSDYYTDRIDICSRMYPTLESIQKDYLDDPKEHRPLLICEYTHAMGNSSGDVADYWKIISKEKRIIGAFVWEWCDHAVFVDGKLRYGSDFPDHKNDGNFCVDGMVTPLREFKSATREIQAVYEGKLYPDTPRLKKGKRKIKAMPIENIAFDDGKGSIQSIVINGHNVLKSPIALCHLRADLDNDIPDKEDQEKRKNASFRFEFFQGDEASRHYAVILEGSGHVYLKGSLDYRLEKDGIKLSFAYKFDEKPRPYRLGFTFAIASESTFSYRGYGPGESYVDKCIHCKYGEFNGKVKHNIDPNLKPQESGSRYCVAFMNVGSLSVDAAKPFSFNVQPYSLKQLSETAHNYELKDERKTFVHLDLAMAGVGSRACGPELDERYQVPEEGENTFLLRFKA